MISLPNTSLIPSHIIYFYRTMQVCTTWYPIAADPPCRRVLDSTTIFVPDSSTADDLCHQLYCLRKQLCFPTGEPFMNMCILQYSLLFNRIIEKRIIIVLIHWSIRTTSLFIFPIFLNYMTYFVLTVYFNFHYL